MTDTNGIDVLVAWAGFLAFVIVLAVFVLRPGADDPVRESTRDTEETRRERARERMRQLSAETITGRVDPATEGLHAPRYPDPTDRA